MIYKEQENLYVSESELHYSPLGKDQLSVGSGSAGVGLCFSRCPVPVRNTVQYNLAHTNKPNNTIQKTPRGALVSRYPVQYLPLPLSLISLGLCFLYPLLSTVSDITA